MNNARKQLSGITYMHKVIPSVFSFQRRNFFHSASDGVGLMGIKELKSPEGWKKLTQTAMDTSDSIIRKILNKEYNHPVQVCC